MLLITLAQIILEITILLTLAKIKINKMILLILDQIQVLVRFKILVQIQENKMFKVLDHKMEIKKLIFNLLVLITITKQNNGLLEEDSNKNLQLSNPYNNLHRQYGINHKFNNINNSSKLNNFHNLNNNGDKLNSRQIITNNLISNNKIHGIKIHGTNPNNKNHNKIMKTIYQGYQICLNQKKKSYLN